MNIRKDILSFVETSPAPAYGCHVNWDGNFYYAYTPEGLIDKVIIDSLANVDEEIRKLDTFSEDHQGALQELQFYRDYLTAGVNH